MEIDRLGERSVSNLLAGIEESKKVPFERVFVFLGIRHVGETLAKKLARQLRTIDAIIHATEEELTATNDIGTQVASSIIDSSMRRRTRNSLNVWKKHGLQFESIQAAHKVQSNKLEGLTFVVSGVFTKFSRAT